MTLISGNARGLGNSRAFNQLSLLVKTHRPLVLFLMETRLKTHSIDRFKTSLGFDFGLEVPRLSYGGGLMLLWKADCTVNILNYSLNHIDCNISFDSNDIWHLTCFYGSPVESNRRFTWDLLDKIYYNAPNLPWAIIGDFNSYLFSSDKYGGRVSSNSYSSSFAEFINKFSLIPLPFIGNKFTWYNSSVKERALKLVLDNNSYTVPSFVNKRFRFENIWLEDPDFYSTIKEVWSDHSVPMSTSGLQFFFNKQQQCVNHLKSWGKKHNSLFKTKISQLNLEIDQLQNKMALTLEESRRLGHLKSALDSLLYKEEIYWRQRARVKWLNAGDRNTNFFHKHASFRKKTNTIKFLKTEDGSVVNTHEGIVTLITDYFQNLFSTQDSDVDAASTIFSYLNSGLEESDVSFLDQEFTPEEVRRAVFQISGDKVVGLDGLNAYFYPKNWSVLGSDFTKAILDCLNNGADFATINSSLIVLIPKKQRAHSLKDFRPISLCTTFYKVISKILANRLKVVLDKIISPNQSTFISSRIIFDNMLLANEVVHAINNRKNGKVGWAALKLDMSKAFDRVEWDFLQSLMYHFNFPVKFVSNIMKCLTTATISFFVNGEVCGKVFPTRGLRQGDPLSPYLFILCSEGLSALLHHSQCQGVLKGVAISRTAPSLTHLLFVDDSILFCMATPSSCEALNSAIHTYSQASGQLINFDKSSILFSPNTQANVRDMFMHTFQLVDKPFISKYLGLPQCFSRAKYQSFAFLKDKVLSVIQSWHHKWFSKAGKEILVKAVLQAIPSYAMACFRVPTKICKELESMVSKFWWGSSPNRPSIHWKKWSMICQSKFVGGMGYRSLVHFNQAMLAKQAWRIFHTPNSLLSLTLKARYFPHTSFLDAVPGHSPSFSWRSIMWGRDLLKRGLLWKVGNGQTINTLDDRWLPNFALKNSDLIATLPSPSLSFFISPSGAWDLNKLRCYFPDFIIDHILDIPIAGHMCPDVLIWGKENSGIFSVKSAYHLAISSRDIPSSSSPLGNKRFWSKLWFSPIPAKVKHCVWRILLNSIPVASNLYHRHIIPAPLCPLCHVAPETVTHAFLECSRVKTAWKNSSFSTFYAEHKSLNTTAYISKAFETFDKQMLCTFFCFLWMVWSQRNNYLHHHRCLSPMFIYDHAVTYLQDFESANLKADVRRNVQQSSTSPHSLVAPYRYKINTDAALDINLKKHSLDVVVRNAQDQVIAGIIAPVIGNVSPEIAEAKAILLALEWAQSVNLPVNVVESDCKSLVDKVNGSFCNYSVMSDLVVRIRHLLSFGPAFILSYVPRELDKMAHNCARAGLGLDSEYVWNGCLPSWLS
ncbi:hypothetical protein CsatB_025848 [Cannabis sativa]